VNGDGFVNQSDYTGVIRPRNGAAIGTAAYIVEADLDRNGVINQLDYDISIADDGKSSSGGVGEAGLFSRGVRNSIGYCGYIFNEDSGLYTVRFRTYSPTLGRWLERDPAGYVDGMDLYEYVRGGPTAAVDPSGRWTVPVSLISSAMLALDCGIRIAKRDSDILELGDEKGHSWIEWHEFSEEGRRLWGTSIGYWPLQTRRDVVPARDLPAGQFPNSTLYGPSRDRNLVVPYISESCGLRDPHERGAMHEWMALRRVKPERYYKKPSISVSNLILHRRAIVSYTTSAFLERGSASGQPCESATCAQIIDCLRHVPPRAEWSAPGYVCHDFVDDALRACCLTKGCKTK
jgi:RHS repeat-associated protein